MWTLIPTLFQDNEYKKEEIVLPNGWNVMNNEIQRFEFYGTNLRKYFSQSFFLGNRIYKEIIYNSNQTWTSSVFKNF